MTIARGIFLVLLSFPPVPLLAQEKPVQLLLPARVLQPDSTFELRFASDMVPADQIGMPAAVSPLVLEPAVRILAARLRRLLAEAAAAAEPAFRGAA